MDTFTKNKRLSNHEVRLIIDTTEDVTFVTSLHLILSGVGLGAGGGGAQQSQASPKLDHATDWVVNSLSAPTLSLLRLD